MSRTFLSMTVSVLAATLSAPHALASDFCHDRTDGYYANPADCGSYIVCFHSGQSEQEMSCPDGLLWNAEGQYCDWADNVTCETGEDITINADRAEECAPVCDLGLWECGCIFEADANPDSACWDDVEEDVGFITGDDLTLQERFDIVVADAERRGDMSLLDSISEALVCLTDGDYTISPSEDDYGYSENYDYIDTFGESNSETQGPFSDDACAAVCDPSLWECGCIFEADANPDSVCWDDVEEDSGVQAGDDLDIMERAEIVVEDAILRGDQILIDNVIEAMTCVIER